MDLGLGFPGVLGFQQNFTPYLLLFNFVCVLDIKGDHV